MDENARLRTKRRAVCNIVSVVGSFGVSGSLSDWCTCYYKCQHCDKCINAEEKP